MSAPTASLVGVVHGTWDGYQNHGCRCDACTDAAAEYQYAHGTTPCESCGRRVWTNCPSRRELFASRDRRCRSCWLEATGQLVHGTEGGYTRGCRCNECRRASAEARARRRRKPNVTKHGWAGYKNGCRCDECRRGHRDWLWLRLPSRRAAA